MFNITAKPLLVALIAVALSACAMQAYEAKPIFPEQSAARFETRSLNSEELRTYMVAQGYPEHKIPIVIWGLAELTLAAFHFHPQLELARAQWQVTQAAKITADQKPNPGISSSLEHHTKTNGSVSPWTLGFAFDIPIATGEKRFARIERATNLSESTRIDIGQVAWQIRSRLRNQWSDYQSTLQQIDLMRREVVLREQIAQMLQERLNAGLVSDIDLNNVRLQAQKALQTLNAEQGKLPGLRAALAEAVGLPVHVLESVQLDTIPPALIPLTDKMVQRSALLNRLDLHAALARYAAAEAKLRLEIAKQQPDITLSPGYSFDQGDIKWTFGLSMILALLNKNEGPIAEANAQRELELRQFEALQIRVIGQADQARAQYQAALDEIDKAEKLFAAQQQRSVQTERQFEAGYADRLEQTGVHLELLSAEQGLLEARIRAQRALGMLEDAIQQPMDNTATFALPDRKDRQS